MSRSGSVDVGALSGDLFNLTAAAAAESAVLTMDSLEEEDNPLNQLQKIELVRNAIRCTADMEARFARRLIDTLEREGIDSWGLATELERVLGRKAGNA